MSSAGTGISDSQVKEAIAKGQIELECGKKLEKLAELKGTAKFVLSVYGKIWDEVHEYKEKQNRLGMRLAEVLSINEMQGSYGHLVTLVEEALKTMSDKFRRIELKLQQAATRGQELEELVLLHRGYEWFRIMVEEHPDELDYQLQDAKIKVEASKAHIQQLKELWKLYKGSIQQYINLGNETVEILFNDNQPQM
ncbi:unnamed protein product [Orchesella dallaii]|uniref:Uncharacterized protein n=1 Tax=Orchesella dallaii TaxID=48710 RepID=A0ABP1QNY8_9HEXA